MCKIFSAKQSSLSQEHLELRREKIIPVALFKKQTIFKLIIQANGSELTVGNKLCIIELSNGLCEHLRACEQCVYLCEHEQWLIFSCR